MMEHYPPEIGERTIPPKQVDAPPRKHSWAGWVWLVILALLAFGVYSYTADAAERDQLLLRAGRPPAVEGEAWSLRWWRSRRERVILASTLQAWVR